MKKFLLCSLFSAFLFSSTSASAQGVNGPNPFLPAQPAQAVAVQTDEDVTRLLEAAGYKARIVRDGNLTVHVLQEQRGDRTYNFGVMLSPNKKFLYTVAFVGNDLPAAERIPAEKLLRLLELNEQYAPSHFTFDRKSNKIKVHMPLYNQGIKADDLKGLISRFVDHIQAGIEVSDEIARTVAASKADDVFIPR